MMNTVVPRCLVALSRAFFLLIINFFHWTASDWAFVVASRIVVSPVATFFWSRFAAILNSSARVMNLVPA
jgi:hypothetical protein